MVKCSGCTNVGANYTVVGNEAFCPTCMSRRAEQAANIVFVDGCEHTEVIHDNATRIDQCLDCGCVRQELSSVWKPIQLKCSDCEKNYSYRGRVPLPDFYQPRCPDCVIKIVGHIIKRGTVDRCIYCGGSGHYPSGPTPVPPSCTMCRAEAVKKAQRASKDKWATMAFRVCDAIAVDSKDQSTQLGSVILGPDHEIRSTGYNSFPRGCNDNIEWRQGRPQKYRYMAHAEENAITNAAGTGTALKGCSIYCQWPPCDRCARMIIGSRIAKVYCRDLIVPERRTDEVIAACEMLLESDVHMMFAELILTELYERKLRGKGKDG